VWHTVAGRSILRQDEVTMAEVFRHSGYATGMFGKWHLGDNYPYRPQDRGFEEVLCHGGGGVAQIPDAWGNDYFDDTYEHNGVLESQTGYCTDVWFAAATDFIEQQREKPFFCYIATNSPHSPYLVDDKYSQPYLKQGVPETMAKFYGMITNLDENVGKLLARLDELKLADNTIVIFMTDNGTAEGALVRKQNPQSPQAWAGYSAGMRGMKQSEYDGGHRAPCFIRWPQSDIIHDRDVTPIAAHFDLLPTLTELCGLKSPREVKYDGISLAPLLTAAKPQWRARTLVVHSQRVEHPEKWRKTAVMTDRWRLINGQELYDMQADPGQGRDIAAKNPEVVAELTKFYDGWWQDVSQRFDEYVRIPLGAKQARVVHLNCHDWHGRFVAYQAGLNSNPPAQGWWAVDVVAAGKYRVLLRDRPTGVEKQLTAKSAYVRIGDVEQSAEVEPGSQSVRFDVELPAGPAKFETVLTLPDGTQRGAYFVTVEKLP
jgi:arylsulfatase A-like enzyme